MPHILASFGVLTYSQEKNIKNRLQLTGYRLSCIGYRWPLSVRHHISAIKHILVTVFYVFLSSWLNPIGIGDVATGFYRRACSPIKSCGHSSKDEVSNRRKGFSWFSLNIRKQCFFGRLPSVIPRPHCLAAKDEFLDVFGIKFCVRLSNSMSPPSRKPY